MITQSIEKYKSEYPRSHGPYFPHQQHHPQHASWHQPNAVQPMGKLEFAKFLQTLGYKKGDFIRHKNSSVCSIWTVQYCLDVLEIHHMVNNWGTPYSGPYCVEVVNYSSVTENKLCNPVWQGASQYIKVEPDQVPTELKQAIHAYFINRTVQTPSSEGSSTQEQQP